MEGFYSSKEVSEKLTKVALKKSVTKARISGGELTLCRKHLLEVLEKLEKSDIIDLFILETNGILFGKDRSYVKQLENFDVSYVRVSLKAGTPKEWEQKTGAQKQFFDLPYKAIEYLWNSNIDFHVAAMADPRITSQKEMRNIMRKVGNISRGLANNIEWETIAEYPNTKKRLKVKGIELD